MPLIDGIGDEVVHFAAVVVVMAVAALAWWSTNARPYRYRTALLMRSHAHHPVLLMRAHAHHHHPVTVSIRTSAPSLAEHYTNRQTITTTGQATTELVTVTSTTTTTTTATESSASNNTVDVMPLQEMDSIVDADMAVLDNERLHFYRRVNSPHSSDNINEVTTDETATQEEAEPASNAQIREMDSIVSAMEADEASNCTGFTRTQGNVSNSTEPMAICKKEKKDKDLVPEENNTDRNAESEQTTEDANNIQTNDRKILIRLKYLNDTLKEVEGSLDELLKDFKWRHFSNELTSEYRVRLIFNGRVLGDDATLRALGLHHRAVVHCLVHPQRTTQQQRGAGGAEGGAAGAARAPPERAWDLENILMTLVSVALTLVWFFRCEYSNMFTASASVALFGLTVFYSVAIFGLYLSDTFHFDRRQPQPVPNN